MKKTTAISFVALALIYLSGCALIYPNWGTDQDPSTSQSPSVGSQSPSPSVSESSTALAKKKATIEAMMAEVDLASQSIYVVGEATNVFETDGTCTLTLTQGSTTKSVTVKSEPNVDTTQCFPGYVSYAGFSKGSALVTVSYESAESKGISPEFKVTIP